MKQRQIRSFMLFLMLLICVAAIYGSLSYRISAKEGEFKFSKSKYTLYEGNILSPNLIKDDIENFQDQDEFWYSGGYFSTSDKNVVDIDYYGNLICVGTGKAVVTATFQEKTAKCTIKVKASKMGLSTYEETLYNHQEIVVKANGIKNIVKDGIEYKRIDAYETSSADDYPSVWSDYKGNFHIRSGKAGDYRIRLIVENNKGKTYSKWFVLHSINAGPERTDIKLAVGGEIEMKMTDADILSMELVNWRSDYYEWNNVKDNEQGEYEEGEEGEVREEDTDEVEKCPIESDGAGGFTASGEGTAVYEMVYMVDDGTVLTANVTVTAYETEYKPFSEYLWVGSEYTLQFEDRFYDSVVTCTSSDPEVLEVTSYGSIIPMKGGTVDLDIWIDGLEFKDTVKVVDLNISDNNVLTWPGAKFSFKVSGLPKGVKVEYLSSNEEVATISKKGKMKAVGTGFAVITVSIDGSAHNFSVNVGQEIPVKAALAAADVVGKVRYSQEKRMEEGYFDCSSLAWRSYNSAGIQIKNTTYAPTAADLAKYMEDNGYVLAYDNIPVEEMQPGDFLFYSGSYDNDRFMWINHVALYYGTMCRDDFNDYYGELGSNGIYGVLVEAGSGGVHFSTLWSDDGAVMVARLKLSE